MAQKLDYTAEQINGFLSKIPQLEQRLEDLNSEVTGVEAILAEV